MDKHTTSTIATWAPMPKTTAGGRAWATMAKERGFKVTGHHGVISMSKHFTPGDEDAYVHAITDAQDLVGRCPLTDCGSTWGSTDDGVGGAIAIDCGRLDLHRSGVSKRFVAGACR